MVNEFNWVSLHTVADRVLRHPLMQDVSFEAIIDYTLDFIWAIGLPVLYEDKTVELEVVDYRVALPSDLVSIIQVMKDETGLSMRTSTGTFMQYDHDVSKSYTILSSSASNDNAFRVQGGVIYTTFETGKIVVAYKGVPVDDNGFPKIPDHHTFLKALELYIKKEWFTIQFDLGRISSQVLQNTLQQYSFTVGQCQNQFTIPSISEMESITNMWSTLIQRSNEFKTGFKYTGAREYLKTH